MEKLIKTIQYIRDISATDIDFDIYCTNKIKQIAIEFIEWTMCKTNWRHFDDDAKTWTNGEDIISTEKLFDKFLDQDDLYKLYDKNVLI